MKFTNSALAGMVGALALSGAAWAQTPSDMGPYVSIAGGINSPTAHDGANFSGNRIVAPPLNTKLSWNTGYDVVAAAGYKFRSGLRGEIELDWRSTKIDRFNTLPASGREQIFGAMGNVYYDFNMNHGVTPYIGGGMGVGHARFSNVTGFSPAATPAVLLTGHDTRFQWQAIGGVSMPVSPRLTMFVEYRYIGLDNLAIGSRASSTEALRHYDDRSHNILIGLRYAFGKAPEQHQEAAAPPPPPPPPPPPAPPPAPPPPPPPPPAPAKILAFFDFDKANLRSDAKEIVAQAAQQFKQTGKAAIDVTGHTDTSGTAQYNMGLSKRRAMAVRAELIRLGVPANEIHVAWKGESEPLVQTGDGVKEPQNRRVEIIYE